MIESVAEDSARARLYPIYVVLLLWGVNIINYMDRMALSVLLPGIKADLGLSDSQLGLLTGLAFSLCYAICGIPLARLADRSSRKIVITGALTVWSVMTGICGLAHNFWHLFLARIGVGVGEAGCIPPSQSLICDYIQPDRRPGALAFHSSGIFVGMMLSMGLAGWLSDVVGWRVTFALLAIPGLLAALLVAVTIREPARGRLDTAKPAAEPIPDLGTTLAKLAQNRAYVFMIFFFVLNGFAQYGFTQWLASFYMRVFHMSPGEVGLPLGIAIGLGSAIGLLGGGALGNRLVKRGMALPLKAGAAATLFAIPIALTVVLADSASVSIFMVGTMCLLLSVSNGPVMATVYNVTDPAIRTIGGAVPIFFGSIFGFGLGPLVVGVLSDFLANEYGTDALRYALIAPICALPVMAFVLWAGARSLPAGMEPLGPRVYAQP